MDFGSHSMSLPLSHRGHCQSADKCLTLNLRVLSCLQLQIKKCLQHLPTSHKPKTDPQNTAPLCSIHVPIRALYIFIWYILQKSGVLFCQSTTIARREDGGGGSEIYIWWLVWHYRKDGLYFLFPPFGEVPGVCLSLKLGPTKWLHFADMAQLC